MKKFILLLSLCIPVMAFAQTKITYSKPQGVKFGYQTNKIESGSSTVTLNEKFTHFTIGNCTFPAPSTASDLNSGYEFTYSIVDENVSGSLDVLGFAEGNYGRDRINLVIEFMQKRRYTCDTSEATFGAGLIAWLSIEDKRGKVDVTNLPKIAASVEMGDLRVSYSLRTIGITGPIALQSLPSNYSFDTQSYMEFFQLVELIKNLYEQDPAKLNITPQLLPERNVTRGSGK